MANNIPERHSFFSKEHTNIVTAEDVSNRWLIGLNQATTTFNAKTQFVTRSPTMPLARRYRADRMFHQRRLNHIFYTDTIYFNCKSINGNFCAQIFSNESFLLPFTHCHKKLKQEKFWGSSLTILVYLASSLWTVPVSKQAINMQ